MMRWACSEIVFGTWIRMETDWDLPGDVGFGWGLPGDLPVAGDWNGDGNDEVGVFRNGAWFLDYNGNRYWDLLVM